MSNVTISENDLRNAIHEIRELRKTNEILHAKVEMIELFASVLYGSPGQKAGVGMSPDAAWMLEKAIEKSQATKGE